MDLLTAHEVETARAIVAPHVMPTPTHWWPLLSERLGAHAFVKHENHAPLGAFKVRGGVVYMHELIARNADCPGVVAATRGNHGQSVARAAAALNLPCTVVVPFGNSKEKNAAMRALGATLVEHGNDFQQAREHAAYLSQQRDLHFVPSFHRDLVRGVATSWMEFFESFANRDVDFPDVVFVPIGQGSGISACVSAKAIVGASTRVVGVVSAHAMAYHDSFLAGHAVERAVTTELADGLACRVPDADSLALILQYVHSIVTVTDGEVATAMRQLFTDTHNVAEGAGAASWAAAMQQRAQWTSRRVGITLCGSNVDADVFARVLTDEM